ncbi:MAG: transcriptional regulator [Flammeovirgaceae bacterium]|nr:transcriptional regulator [Flammeovirgaceae bacterium]HCX20494.1 transcriptional regulator [Cytophagales bacterium]|tara:strand:+ start:14842 stop:15210 length:369 start_codon:yes stop_codon:yes gene_type:complete
MPEQNLKKYSDIENCPIRNVLDHIGDKWSMLVLSILNEEGTLRFNQIHKTIGTVSQKMLSTTLKRLESDGLLVREVFPEIPPRVEYQLTERGKSLIPHINNLVGWAVENFDGIKDSRLTFTV